MKSLFLSFILLLLVSSCNQEPTLTHIEGKIMGTTYNIKIARSFQKDKKENLEKEIFNILNGINSLMSTYLETSELSTLNQYQGEWFTLTPQTYEVIYYAQEVENLTSGAYDITAGPLVNLWGFGPGSEKKVPTKTQIYDARQSIGYKNLGLNKETKQVKKSFPKMYVDLSSIAKGYAVDKLAEYFDKRGMKNYMIEIGGEVRAKGKKNQENWKIGIQKPMEGKLIQKIIDLENMSIATSGNYQNFFEVEGVKYGHTIDPRTGKPTEHKLLSVSVFDESCMKADAWATALMVLGPDEGYAKSQELGLKAYFIFESENGIQTLVTDALKGKIGE